MLNAMVWLLAFLSSTQLHEVDTCHSDVSGEAQRGWTQVRLKVTQRATEEQGFEPRTLASRVQAPEHHTTGLHLATPHEQFLSQTLNIVK